MLIIVFMSASLDILQVTSTPPSILSIQTSTRSDVTDGFGPRCAMPSSEDITILQSRARRNGIFVPLVVEASGDANGWMVILIQRIRL